jgi:hypothetical protein
MPDLSERQIAVGDHNMVTPAQSPVAHFPPVAQPVRAGTGFTRSPMPPIWSSNPDSLAQFEKSVQVPQVRIWTPPLKGNSTS